MTTITITRSSDDNYKRIECKGHAGFDDYGKDIVCAAVSVLTINTINSLEELTDDDLVVTQDEKKGIITMEFDNKLSDSAVLLLKSYELGINGIYEEYGKKYLNIKIRRE
ncbi:ribosomal-processing cysteine protease Prp [Butyrivibrio sp. AE2032]|uniref:ribosomal-processing cysteine protease Prp n=1 Tax=Butyrivibrio sp. AE2032 TaxID=1458463 RepID=UPI00054F85B9|nr:ribosomal-processing cysteine protease Prp [Butyrivibrio sp. AE2032]